MIDQAIALVEQNGDLFMMPELLRIKAAILMTSPAGFRACGTVSVAIPGARRATISAFVAVADCDESCAVVLKAEPLRPSEERAGAAVPTVYRRV